VSCRNRGSSGFAASQPGGAAEQRFHMSREMAGENMRQTLFENPLQHGKYVMDETPPFGLVYERQNGRLYEGDSVAWLTVA